MSETRESEDFARVGLVLSAGGILYPSLYRDHRTTPPSTLAFLMAVFAATAGGASALDKAGSIAAIIGASIAALLLLVGFARWHLARRRRASVARLLYEGNVLFTRLANTDESSVSEWNALLKDVVQWWTRTQETVGAFRKDLLPVLQSDTGTPIYTYGGHNEVYRSHRNWLTQRIRQLEKALQQL